MSSYTRRDFVKHGVAGVAGITLARKPALTALERDVSGQPRIAVIGAGPAGLTAARTLKQLGYSNVVVFERSATPGGKVHTDNTLGGPVELGAVLATSNYTVVLQLAREVGAPMVPVPTAGTVLDDDGTVIPLHEFAVRKYGAAEVQRAQRRYLELTTQHEVLGHRSFAGVSPDLYVPFQDLVDKHQLMPFLDTFRIIITSYGCGYFENVPAMYFVKTFGVLSDQHFIFPRGYQDLWLRVAHGLDVRCSADVTAVRRHASSKGARIELLVNGVEHEFDKIIVAAPCGAAARFLDLTSEESDLFGRVVKRNYQVNVSEVDGLSADRQLVYSYPSTRPSAAGHVACWYRPLPPKSIYTAYQNVGPQQSDADARRLLEQDFANAGGKVASVLLHKTWDDYFEHVETAALRDRFYERFEGLQGKNGTFYATGLLSLEGVEAAARYARDLVRELFVPQRA